MLLVWDRGPGLLAAVGGRGLDAAGPAQEVGEVGCVELVGIGRLRTDGTEWAQHVLVDTVGPVPPRRLEKRPPWVMVTREAKQCPEAAYAGGERVSALVLLAASSWARPVLWFLGAARPDGSSSAPT